MFDLIHLAMQRAAEQFGGDRKQFNSAEFGAQMMRLAGLQGVIDGRLVEVMLCGRRDVEQLPGGAHYSLVEHR